jgi:hypothetical protein
LSSDEEKDNEDASPDNKVFGIEKREKIGIKE